MIPGQAPVVCKMATVEAKYRNRSKNFESTEIQLLTDLVEQNSTVINSKFTNSVTNEKKKQVWENITAEINSLGVCQRTTKEIKTKWGNMYQAAKKEFSDRKLHQTKTGGGPCSKPVSASIEKIVDLYSESPSFTGLSGVESSVLDQGQNIEIQGSPMTLDLLTRVLQDQQEAVIPTTEATEPSCSTACLTTNTSTSLDHPSTDLMHRDSTATFTQQLPSTSRQSTGKDNRPIKSSGKRKIKPEDVTQLQYEVLQEQKKKLIAQTTYYELMNRKLRHELGD